MEKLQQREVEVYRTDECGTVIATITGKECDFLILKLVTT